jgi:predicted transport protein
LASEYSTGRLHAGRIDTIGLDENGAPVIIEYKRRTDENIINQGLFYLDWLLDHKAEFEGLVQRTLHPGIVIDWESPRLVCIASDFTRYDEHAVRQIDRSIDLIRYRRFDRDLLLLEAVNSTFPESIETLTGVGPSGAAARSQIERTVSTSLSSASNRLKELFHDVQSFCLGLGEDVELRTTQQYFAFRRLKNFACVIVQPGAEKLLVTLKVDPATIQLEQGFSRDVTSIGHWGTGNLELTIKNLADFERSKSLISMSYNGS